MNTVSSRDIL